MVEIMCRDGKMSQEDLEKLADMIYYSTGVETVAIAEEDRRAMVFWGPEDVKEIVERLNIKSFDPEDKVFCDTIVQAAEGKIHQAMLEAGRDVLFDEVCETAESLGENIFVDDEVKDDTPYSEPVSE